MSAYSTWSKDYFAQWAIYFVQFMCFWTLFHSVCVAFQYFLSACHSSFPLNTRCLVGAWLLWRRKGGGGFVAGLQVR